MNRLRALPRPVQILILAGAHYASARLGLAFGRLDSIVAPVWPPSGVAVAGLLLFGVRAWPGVALSSLAVDLGGDLPAATVAGMVAGTTLEAVVATALLHRARFRAALTRLRDVAALVGLGVVACAVGASLGAGSMVAGGAASGGFLETWRVWWLGDVLGLLVVAPALMMALASPPPRGGRRRGALVLAGATGLLALAAFGPDAVPPYVLLPFVTWVAARHATAGVAPVVLLAAAIGIVRTNGGSGAFAEADPVQSLYQLDTFLAVLGVSGLALGAMTSERNRAHADLREANLRLEAGIAERTAALAQDRARLAEAQQIAHLGSWEWELASDRLLLSEELCRIHGFDPVDYPTTLDGYFDSLLDDDRPEVLRIVEDARLTGAPFTLDYRIVRADGTRRWLHGEGRAVGDAGGRARRMIGTCHDVTDRKLTEERFRDLLDAAPDAMVIVGPDGTLDLVNRQTEVLLGYDRDELVGRRVEVLLPERFRDGHVSHRAAFFSNPKTRTMGEGSELYVRGKDGREIPVEISLSPLQTESGTIVSAAIRDVSSRKLAEEKLAHQAMHDSLTGLPNRTLLADRLAQAVARAGRTGGGVAVLFLDLDRFKLINDSLGHAAGDEVLVAVAERLRTITRASDTVARFGGDEFVVVCEDPDEAPHLADRLAAALAQPLAVDGEDVFLSVSVGVAVVDASSPSPEAVLRDADAAMYRAKERGRARIECFDETMRIEAAAKLESHSALHRALEREQLRVHYQPIIEVATGRVATVEALLRWEHPERGLVGPGQFIAVAEESGLIVPIGEWVIEEAARHHARWRERHPELTLGINLSARQLRHPDLLPTIRRATEAAGIDPGALCLELTESVLMEDLDAFLHTLDALRDLGAQLAIDDFGTGYSSLTYLRRFPVDLVKIDRTFVKGVGHDPADLAIVESVVELSHALGMRVVAEGVESAEQLHLLERLGCDLVQGFYFDRARPAEAVDGILDRCGRVVEPSRL